MNNFSEKLVNDLQEVFGDNLVCVLLVGSVQKNDITPFSDIDLVAILKKMEMEQIKEVRNFLRESTRLIDLSFLCRDEIPKNPNLFTLGTHGCYQLGLILNKAKCLYGENILLDMESPNNDSIRQTIIQKNLQYNWWIRRMFVESNRERTLASNYQINSRLIKLIKGLLFLDTDTDIHISASRAVELCIGEYPSIFSTREKHVILGLANSEKISANSANMSEEYLEIRFSIYNKIQKQALKFYA